MEAGDVYWVNIPASHTVGHEQRENRPYAIVSRREVNDRGTVVGVPFTSVKDRSRMSSSPPFWIYVPDRELTVDWGANFKPEGSLAKAEQLRVLDPTRLGTKIGTLSSTALIAIRLGIAWVMDLDDRY